MASGSGRYTHEVIVCKKCNYARVAVMPDETTLLSDYSLVKDSLFTKEFHKMERPSSAISTFYMV
jgi:hypothetical protein